jgi:prepilin signal peptidase PulO-like enzyme (type II secretory pathway)
MVLVLGFGVLLTISQGRHNSLFSWLCLPLLVAGVLLSLTGASPWWHGASFCAFLLAGRLWGNFWLDTHELRTGPILDDFAWIVLIIGIYSLLVNGLRARRVRTAVEKSL